MNKENALLKTLLAALASFCLMVSASAVQARQPAKSKSAQKIAKLKQELSAAKGQRRVKLIKKIAEMENKVLEHKLQSFR